MLYVADRELSYPRKALITDALLHPIVDDDSYSNIGDVVLKAVEEEASAFEDFWIYVKRENFLEVTKTNDFKLDKMFTDKAVDGGIDYTVNEVLKMQTSDIIQKVVDYVVQSIRRFTRQTDAFSNLKKTSKVSNYIIQNTNDGEEMIHSSALILENDEDDFITNKMMENKVNELIYYLKIMSEISIVKGYNIIQLLILKSRYSTADAITDQGIEEVNALGQVVKKRAKSFNTTKQWSELWEWFISKDKDVWNIQIDKFLSVVKELGIDLSKEDHTIYDINYVNSKMTTYIKSNEEVMEDGTIGNKNLVAMLQPGMILADKSSVNISTESNNTVLNKIIGIYEELRQEAHFNMSNASSDATSGNAGRKAIARGDLAPYIDNEEAVKSFLDWFYSLFNVDTKRVCSGRVNSEGFWVIMDKKGDNEIYMRLPKSALQKKFGIKEATDVYILGSGYAAWDNIGSEHAFYICPLGKMKEDFIIRRFPIGEVKNIQS